jgi:CO/xanthine dehydrogenase FAD-binding subunit
MAKYLQPDTIEKAVSILVADKDSEPQNRLSIVAGATDFYPASTTRQAWGQPMPDKILDISCIKELQGIVASKDYLRIGALATWSDLLNFPLSPAFDALKKASRQVGGVQIQNRGTLVGNICNASPAADGMPPLLALDAEVEIASANGRRVLPLTSFVQGNRRTALEPGEIVTALHVPLPADREKSVFLKLGARSYLVISIVSVAANIAVDATNKITVARIAVGACSAVPQRLGLIEQRLLGLSMQEAAQQIKPEMLASLNPIDDVRASASYRRNAAWTLINRALAELGNQSRQAA